MDVEKIVREYIDKSIHLSLGTSVDNFPWVSEVHFVYDKDLNLYFRSLKSRRHSQEIAKNSNVAGNIVKQHSLNEYPHAVYFEGKAEIINDESERLKIYPLFKKRLGSGKDILEDAKNNEGHQFYKVTVSNWYAFGKFDGTRGQKYELKWHGASK